MKQSILSKDGVSYVVPFILITSCFALWGFANDITNPMVKAFSKIFRMSATDGALVQVAFYGGYFAMAFPAAMFIRRYSYKAGVLVGLGLYALGALLFYPAKMTGEYYPFLVAYFILTCGLSFLETSSNPYILSMGTEETATRRLNLAQSFNPMGSLLGMFVAMNFIQAKISPLPFVMAILLLTFIPLQSVSALFGREKETPRAADGAPVAENMEIRAYRGVAYEGAFRAVDNEGGALCFAVAREPKKGAVTLTEDGLGFVYTPHGKLGSDSFTYTASDAYGNTSLPATVSVTIEKANSGVCYADMAGNRARRRSMNIPNMPISSIAK